jgi:hypothetical protein
MTARSSLRMASRAVRHSTWVALAAGIDTLRLTDQFST